MDGSSAQSVKLSIPLARPGTPLGFAWGTDSSLNVFPRAKPQAGSSSSAPQWSETAKNQDCAPSSSIGNRVSEVRWSCHAFRPKFRKLISESHQYFLQVQDVASAAASAGGVGPGGDGNNAQLLKFSRLYRAVMKTCAMQMSEEEDDGDEAQLLELQELIWSLVEILFIDAPSGGLILNQLLEWIHQHFPTGERHAPLILEDVASTASSDDSTAAAPEDSVHFWPAIMAFVLQGQLDRAREVLALHSSHLLSDDKSPMMKEALNSVDELLRKMPLFSAYVGKSVTEFDLRWQRWREECQLRLAKGVFNLDSKLELIVRILTGDENAFRSDEVMEISATWYNLLISKLLYTNPTIKAIDVQYHIRQAMDFFMVSTDQTPTAVDGILQAAFEFDLHTVVKDCCSHLPNWWMAAHLTDLLHHCGQLDLSANASSVLDQRKYRCSFREHILLEYPEGLLTHGSLWQVGVSYLDHCPQYGRQHLALHLEKLPVDSDAKATKVLRVMEKRGLTPQAFSLCRVLAIRALKSSRLGAALSWAIKSKDVAFASFVAEKLLTDYSTTGRFSHLDILDHLGPDMALSDKLAFLGKYREFHLLYENSEFSRAGQLLLSLLTAKLAPKRFWLMLLMDTLPLLETGEVIFDVDDTYELMHCLEELRTWSKLESTTSGGEEVNGAKAALDEEKTGLLRLALARNLARALVEPAVALPEA